MVTLAVSCVFVWEQKNDSPDISEHKTRKKVTQSKKKQEKKTTKDKITKEKAQKVS